MYFCVVWGRPQVLGFSSCGPEGQFTFLGKLHKWGRIPWAYLVKSGWFDPFVIVLGNFPWFF
jgi:hypothetical protein